MRQQQSSDGWVLIPIPHRLWSAVPAEERVTPEDIDGKPRLADFYRDRLHKRLRAPSCEIALKATDFPGKWLPCVGTSYEGNRCARHGGPTKQEVAPVRRTKADLEAEVAELRRRLGADL